MKVVNVVTAVLQIIYLLLDACDMDMRVGVYLFTTVSTGSFCGHWNENNGPRKSTGNIDHLKDIIGSNMACILSFEKLPELPYYTEITNLISLGQWHAFLQVRKAETCCNDSSVAIKHTHIQLRLMVYFLTYYYNATGCIPPPLRFVKLL
jgi:hypothetical protein